jgi:hypothetical protein
VPLASQLPAQSAPLTAHSLMAKSATANTDTVEVRYGGWHGGYGGWHGGWGGWHGGWGGWGWGAGALAGALIAAPYYYGGYDPYYYAAPYAEYDEYYVDPGDYAGYYHPYWHQPYWHHHHWSHHYHHWHHYGWHGAHHYY